jgi:predicted nuclease of predicted toxin-antitoxin system
MNLSPQWVEDLTRAGFEAVHWSSVGDARTSDKEILHWAADHGHVLLTHDLDFGAILAAAGAAGPSVVQLRATDITPAGSGSLIRAALIQYRAHLERGALITLDETSLRARILPIRK